MAIKYKVVNKDRNSAFARGKYKKFYKKDTTVKAVLGSVGIMVFERKKEAKNFAKDYCPNQGRILRVKTVTRGKRLKEISPPIIDLQDFYRGKCCPISPPKGTMGYDQVIVLD